MVAKSKSVKSVKSFTKEEAVKLEKDAKEVAAQIEEAEKLTSVVPLYFTLGSIFAKLQSSPVWCENHKKEKRWEISCGRNRWSRSIRIFKHFKTAEKAKAYRGSLRDLDQKLKTRTNKPNVPLTAERKAKRAAKFIQSALELVSVKSALASILEAKPEEAREWILTAYAELTAVTSVTPNTALTADTTGLATDEPKPAVK